MANSYRGRPPGRGGRARRIIQALLGRTRVPQDDLQEGLSIADIEEDTEVFLEHLEILRAAGLDVPALTVDRGRAKESLPFNLAYFTGEGAPGTLSRNALIDIFRAGIERQPVRLISREMARSTFESRAISFLSIRISALNSIDPPGRPHLLSVAQRYKGPLFSSPGCLFQVSANTAGLRVMYSGAYCVSPKYFNAPTSPVTRTLLAGTYMFGVDGGIYGTTVQWDTVALVSLPGVPSLHLNF